MKAAVDRARVLRDPSRIADLPGPRIGRQRLPVRVAGIALAVRARGGRRASSRPATGATRRRARHRSTSTSRARRRPSRTVTRKALRRVGVGIGGQRLLDVDAVAGGGRLLHDWREVVASEVLHRLDQREQRLAVGVRRVRSRRRRPRRSDTGRTRGPRRRGTRRGRRCTRWPVTSTARSRPRRPAVGHGRSRSHGKR